MRPVTTYHQQTITGLLAYHEKLLDGVRALQKLAMESMESTAIRSYLHSRKRLDELQRSTVVSLFEERGD